jgi:hypothetical protein
MTEILKKLTRLDIRNPIAFMFTVLSFYFLFTLLKHKIPPENKDVVIAISGVIVGQLVTITGFYFTQSKSEVDGNKKPPVT